MKSIYLVVQPDYESVYIVSAHSTYEDAEEVVAYLKHGRDLDFSPYVYEMTVDSFEQIPIPEGKRDYEVILSRNSHDEDWMPLVFEGSEEMDRQRAAEGWTQMYALGQKRRFQTHLWATNEDEAIGIAFERLREYESEETESAG